MVPRQITQLFILLLYFAKNSDQKCDSLPKTVTCDSLQDLYGNSSLKENVVIFETTGLETFRIVPNERAKDIERLKIQNAINNLSRDVIKNFLKLKTLHFYSNKIEIIRNETLENQNLEILAFYECSVKTIENDAFVNLPKLKELRITINNLTQIQKKVFNNLPIRTLALSGNQISQIEKLSFANLPNLEYLFLDNNNLSEFNVPEFVTNLSKLKRLWLHQNKISEITNYMLEGLTNLSVLNLGFNRISQIEPKSFEQTPKLTTLVLAHNFLKILDGSVLPSVGLQELKILYLDHNRLMYLSSNFLFRLNSLKLITIGGNPWSCPCLDLVLRWLDDNNVDLKCDKEFFNGERPTCVVPLRKNSDVCVYSYDERSFNLFKNYYETYSSTKFCLL